MDLQWAQSLVGRDWEIFWDNGNHDKDTSLPSTKSDLLPNDYEGFHVPISIGTLSSVETNDTISLDRTIQEELLAEVSRLLPPLMPDEYDTIIQSTSSGLLMNLTMAQGQCVAFSGYVRYSDGSVGPTEANRCIRQVGDVIIAINGESVIGMQFSDVVQRLRESSKNKNVALRLQSCRSIGVDSDKESSQPTIIQKESSPTDENEEDIIDWYDGRILSFTQSPTGYIFDVQFLGDAQIYTMKLNRMLVRPSARAWLIRTKAVLSGPKVEQWEASLPPDTATVEDRSYLQETKQNLRKSETLTSLWKTIPAFTPIPSYDHFNRIQQLQHIVQSQIYLRTKLAPIVQIGEQSQENEPTEAYVAHLVSCLNSLDEACHWYNKCCLLMQQVFDASSSSLLIDASQLYKDYVEAGFDVIRNMLSMDTGPGRWKRKSATQNCSARRTRRKRIRRAPDSSSPTVPGLNYADDDHEFLFDLNNQQVFSPRGIDRFTKKVRGELGKWFEVYFVDILASLASNIQAPVEGWIIVADRVLCCADHDNDDQRFLDSGFDEKEDDESNDENLVVDRLDHNTDHAFYSYENVSEVLQRVASDAVLSRMDFSHWTARLDAKLRAIEEFEADAWNLVAMLADEGTSIHETDPILDGLERLKLEVHSASSQLSNVHPLGKSRFSKMTKQVIDDALVVRRWVVDLLHAERQRERDVFLQDLVARVPNLPRIPSVPDDSLSGEALSSRLADMFARVQPFSSKPFSNVEAINQFEIDLLASSDPSANSCALRTPRGVHDALQTLASLPVLTLVEEKLAVRQDILLWVEELKSHLHHEPRSLMFSECERYHDSLCKILGGASPSRRSITRNLLENESVEKEINLFSNSDFEALSDDVGPWIQASYRAAAAWKERAELIMTALRVHGNAKAGALVHTSKTFAMVDSKRMGDLLQDYDGLKVTIPESYQVIHDIYSEATRWSLRVTSVVENEQDILGYIIKCRDERPRGVIVDPARHILDGIIELLEWHKKVKQLMHQSEKARGPSEVRTTLLIYSSILDGLEVVEQFTAQQEKNCKYGFNRKDFVDFLARIAHGTKPSKVIAVSKLESTPLGQRVLNRIFSSDFDAAEGFPFFSMIHFLWVARVSNYVHAATSESVVTRPTLQEALVLRRCEPKTPGAVVSLSMYGSLKSHLDQFAELIRIGQAIEGEAKQLMLPENYRFPSLLLSEDEIQDYMISLKNLQTRYKAPKNRGEGLMLDQDTEKSIDRIAKDLSWLARTLKFQLLHDNNAKIERQDRIPWSELANLHDRIPSKSDEIGRDYPLVAIRVKELYDAAGLWQDKVLSLLSLSVRGAKRRHAGSQEGEIESPAKVSNLQVAELVKDPILETVAIPIESAVQEVLRKVEEFEKLMHDLFGRDFSADVVDRAPYPEGPSLVGVDGEFHLYRLTGNPMFASLKVSIEEISRVSADIAADTPGKEVFEWIFQCVSWIDNLNNAVTEVSPFRSRDRLVILDCVATRILDEGKHLFLEISEDVKKSLSAQRIGISTNKIAEKLTVSIAKGGSLHSVGGTFIKWCPLIFDWLRYDTRMNIQWVERANLILDEASQRKVELMNMEEISQEKLNLAYRCLENLKLHLEHGRDKLVVVPAKNVVDQLTSLQLSFSEWIHSLEMQDGSGLNHELARIDMYTNTTYMIKERHTLLDSLLTRRHIEPSSSIDPLILHSAGSHFREKARSKLENKVIRKGMTMMGFKVDGRSDIGLFCTLKAWEIESAAFSEYCEGQSSVNTQYTSKLTSVFNNLDPMNKPTLCARVLVNQVSAHELLEMQVDEISPHNKMIEIKSAPSQTVMTKSPEVARQSVKSLLMIANPANSPTNTKVPSNPATRSSTAPSAPILSVVGTGNPSGLLAGTRQLTEQVITDDSLSPTARIASIAAKPPPPPPPPLFMQLSAKMAQSQVSRSSETGLVVSQSGSYKFTFIIAGDDHKSTNYEFQAQFAMEADSYSDIDGVVQETIKSKGRLQLNNFNDFVASKMKSGRSSVIVMRVSICGGSKDFKRFYKDYETKQRLAFFLLEGGHHLFLVTPKYHSAATVIRERLVQKNKTYAVLIRKRTD